MAGITIRTLIEAPPSEVWADIADLTSHVEWMADAVAIRLTGAQRSGVGATFDCDTRVGPVRLTDRMEVTEWVSPWVIGVRHVGLVTGTGRFTLAPAPGGATDFTWTEQLVFPLWLGGRLGAAVGGTALRLIWNRNLAALKERIERQAAPHATPGR